MSDVAISDPVEAFLEAWQELIAPGGSFAMQEEQVGDQVLRTFVTAPPSLRFVWEMSAGYADRTYLVFEDERLTYGEVHARVRSLAHHLAEVHGVRRGDRVAVSMRNYPEWIITYWATVSLGAALVGMNAWWTTKEMAFGVRDSRPKVLVVDDERWERLQPVLGELQAEEPFSVIVARHAGDLPDHVAHWNDVVDGDTAPDALPEAVIEPDDDATIFYTSGTTGFPKGAQLTHRGSVHNIMHLVFMTSVTGLANAKLNPPDPDAPPAAPSQLVYLAGTPMFHVTACNCLLHPVTLGGGTIVMLHRWDAGRALELIEREGITNISGVPSMSREVLTHPDFATRDVSSLKGLAGGGAPVPPDLVAKIGERVGAGSATTGYGLTETSGIITANGAACYEAKPASCGPVVPTVDAKLLDDLGNEVSGPGVTGRLLVRGPIVVKGYLNRPEATAEAIVDGWFDTGDIAHIDEQGFVYLVDRAKDMVLRGGENVYCAEVEAAIYEHPAVAEAAVFGVPEERLGEAVAAVVVLADGASLTTDELQAFVAERIAKHKVPTEVVIRTEALPRNATGKFLKRELREQLFAAEPS